MTLRREGLVLGALALALLLAHLAFHGQDTAPPVWDEALHLLLAARFHDFLDGPSRQGFERLRAEWDFYPPLYHACVGALFRVVGLSALAARLVNLALLAVLGWGTHRAASALFGRAAGAVAAAFVVTFPVVTMLARMAMTDLGLAAFAAASAGHLMATDLRTRKSAVGLGLLLGAGMLSKWIFPAFVAGPVIVWAWSRARERDARSTWLGRLGLAVAVAGVMAAPWYADNAGTILTRGRLLAGLGPAQGNPHGWNWANATVYARVILDTFVTAPQRLVLLAAAAAGLVCALGVWRPSGPRPADSPPRFDTSAALTLVALWLIVPYVAMTAISNKDPRFVLPLVAPLAVLCAWGLLVLPHRTLRRAALAAVFLYLAVLYGLAVTASPPRGLARLPTLDAALRRDLRNLRPAPDPGWPSAAIVEALRQRLTPVSPRASLEVVPDLSTVNPNTLAWLARRAGFRLDAHHPQDAAEVDALSWEYALIKPEGDQGAAHTTGASAAITARVLDQADAFEAIQDFTGRAGTLRLLRTRASVPPPGLRAEIIELSSPAARWYLGEGWGMAEAAGRWALGRDAVVRVQLEAGRAYRLKVDLAPFPRLAHPQAVTVSYREVVLGTWHPADPGGRVYGAEIPAGLPTGGIDEVRFRFAERARPSELGLSGDTRTLAAFFRRVRIVPR
jgi:hypothetical protein